MKVKAVNLKKYLTHSLFVHSSDEKIRYVEI